MADEAAPGRELIGLSEAAAVARVSRKTIHYAAKRGELEHIETAIGRLFRRASVVAWRVAREARAAMREVASNV